MYSSSSTELPVFLSACREFSSLKWDCVCLCLGDKTHIMLCLIQCFSRRCFYLLLLLFYCLYYYLETRYKKKNSSMHNSIGYFLTFCKHYPCLHGHMNLSSIAMESLRAFVYALPSFMSLFKHLVVSLDLFPHMKHALFVVVHPESSAEWKNVSLPHEFGQLIYKVP